jgi:hypothetical protein
MLQIIDYQKLVLTMGYQLPKNNKTSRIHPPQIKKIPKKTLKNTFLREVFRFYVVYSAPASPPSAVRFKAPSYTTLGMA